MNFVTQCILYFDMHRILKNEMMHCHCRTDTRTTVNMYKLLETIGKTRWLGGFIVYCLKLTCRHINHRHICFNIKSISVHPLLWMNVMLDFICMVFAWS